MSSYLEVECLICNIGNYTLEDLVKKRKELLEHGIKIHKMLNIIDKRVCQSIEHEDRRCDFIDNHNAGVKTTDETG